MINPLDFIPKFVWAALVAVLAATSCKLKIDNTGLSLEIEKNATRIAELHQGISAANVNASQLALAYQTQSSAAITASKARERSLANDAAAARTELERLRVAVSERSFGLRANSNTLATSVDYTSPFPELFLACSERYIDMARIADGHASDVETLIDAWPKEK